MQGALKGYKTYIVAGVGIIGAVAAYAVGDCTAFQAAQTIGGALLTMTLRAGIAKGIGASAR